MRLDASPRVEIWIVPHHVGERPDDGVLSKDEINRATRFVAPRPRAAFVAARRALRTILGDHVGDQPANLEFSYSRQGKPSLRNHEALAFSVSHTRDVSIIAIGRDMEMGIDIEGLDATPDFMEMADRFFPAREAAAIRSAPKAAALTAFMRAWTRKEALAKAAGDSIADALSAPVSTEPLPDGYPTIYAQKDGSARSWFLHAPDIGAEWIVSLAVSRQLRGIDLLHFPA